ncbi:hypothetical protein BN14_05703 [Rhizoctonia solani AG-1 IB]|uniref:Uncharacterized protein n=1 Tax=Thanatephorus cucumeris (strain AG1-IB / isolate 7/3/14) TaxID=1108050 RepID=M5BWX7_THACB|nr:hypothetical protein BN14_05703 [Rhizoctonia solani AG-1 IB]
MFFTRLAVAALSAGAAFAAPLGGLPPVADDIALPAAVPAGLPAAPAIPAAIPAAVPAELSGVPVHRLRRGLTEAIPAGVPAGIPAVPAAPAGLSDAPFALPRAYDSSETLQKIKELANHIDSDMASMSLDHLSDETKVAHIASNIAKLRERIDAVRPEDLMPIDGANALLLDLLGLVDRIPNAPSLKPLMSGMKVTLIGFNDRVMSGVSDMGAHGIMSTILSKLEV